MNTLPTHITDAIDCLVSKFANQAAMPPISETAIEAIEQELNVTMPQAYRYLLVTHGLVRTPNVLTKICDLSVEFTNVQDFLSMSDVVQLTKLYPLSGMPHGYILFASDCQGNMFCFKASDCVDSATDAAVWFYIAHQNKVVKISDAFSTWLSNFNLQ